MKNKKFTNVVAEIVRIEGGGICDFGHRVGEKFEFNEFGSNKKMCIYAQQSLMPAIEVLLHNGKFPWLEKGDQLYWGCPHPGTIYKRLGQVIFKLEVKEWV